MEALTRLVADSLARHGFDRPVDPRRLQWSRWFRCDSPHSLLVVPSKPGIFAIAEEIMDLGASKGDRVGAGDSPAQVGGTTLGTLGGAALQRCDSLPRIDATLAAEVKPVKRMLAVLQFAEDEDMAFTLDRMFTCANPMRAGLASGRCFLRFVVIEDQVQRRNICNALNQWMHSSAEKASGIGIDFQSSLEFGLAHVGAGGSPAHADTPTPAKAALLGQEADVAPTAPHLDSGANKNLHCPHPLPSGF
jgi:hypothetical protein